MLRASREAIEKMLHPGVVFDPALGVQQPNPLVPIAFMVNSALYLSGCFIAGILTANGAAWKLALASAGVTVFCYQAQLGPAAFSTQRRSAAATLSVISIGLGAAAGLALLWRS